MFGSSPKIIPVLDHPPYWPGLAPCEFYLFSEGKSALKGIRFQLLGAVNKKSARVMKETSITISNNEKLAWYVVGMDEECLLKVMKTKYV